MASRNCVLIAALLLFTGPAVIAQIERPIAPIKWERYRIPDRKVSLILPKLPTVLDGSNPCSELEKKSYYAYADQTVYELVVVAKSRSKPPDWCLEKKRFDEGTFSVRLSELRNEKSGSTEVSLRKFDRQVLKFDNGLAARWVVSDLENDRWIELAIHGRENRKENEDRFLESLDLDGSEGKNIGDGAATILGDEPTNAPTKPPEQKAAAAEGSPDQKVAAVADSLRIIAKPRARYTDAARQANVSGSVLIKVTMLANGSVGNVTPVKELSHGLTEQAIWAAKRLVFLPKRVNGVPITVAQTFEYTFSIY